MESSSSLGSGLVVPVSGLCWSGAGCEVSAGVAGFVSVAVCSTKRGGRVGSHPGPKPVASKSTSALPFCSSPSSVVRCTSTRRRRLPARAA